MKSLILFLVLLVPYFSSAAQAKFSGEQVELVSSAQIYLDRLENVKARFIQFNPQNSSIINGELYILRPGKLLMRYNAPFKIDYFLVDDNFIQYDYDLDQVTRTDASESPLNILLYKGIKLINNDLVILTSVIDKGNFFELYFTNKTEDLAEEISGLTLKFSKLPIELTGITRVDAAGNSTDLTFSQVITNDSLKDEVFEFERPKPQFPKAK